MLTVIAGMFIAEVVRQFVSKNRKKKKGVNGLNLAIITGILLGAAIRMVVIVKFGHPVDEVSIAIILGISLGLFREAVAAITVTD